MKVKYLKLDNSVSEIDLSIDLGKQSKSTLEYEVALLSRIRNQALKQGTKSTKDRAQVQGKSAKPYKQKGTGRARQGSRKGPHFVGGGVSHGPTIDTTKLYLNKKAKSVFFKRLVANFIDTEVLNFVDINGESKSVRKFFSSYPKSLVVYSAENLENSRKLQNLKGVELLRVDQINAYDFLGYKKVFIDEKAQNDLINLLNR
jgi:large subunit ribosomal protein L4